MDRWSRLLPQTRRRVRRLFTDPGSCGWLRDRRQRERGGGGGAAGWLEPPKPNRCSVIGQNSIEERGWFASPRTFPLVPGQFLPLPSHGCASFVLRSQLPVARVLASGNDEEGLAAYRSQQRRPPVCRGSRSHAIGRSLLRSGLQEDYVT